MSSGRATRPLRIEAENSSIACPGRSAAPISIKSRSTCSHISVATTPGANPVTVIPCFARSRAPDCVSATTANFEAQYGATLSNPCRLAMLAVLMILPCPPWAIIWRAASCIPIMQPRPLMPMMKFQFSSVTSRKFIGLFTPALLNLTSSRPKMPTVWAIIALTCSRSVTSTAACATRASARAARAALASATSATLSALMSAKQTFAPSSSNASPMARPMPCAAPVTMQDRPETPVIPFIHMSECRRKHARQTNRPARSGRRSEDGLVVLVLIFLSDLRRVEVVEERNFLAVEHIDRRFQSGFRVIDRRLVDRSPVIAVLHGFVAHRKVGGTDKDDAVATRCLGSIQGADAHVVIARVDAVDIVILDEERLHDLLRLLAVPVARLLVDLLHVGADFRQTIIETLGALDRCGVARLTGDMHDLGFVLDAHVLELVAHDLGRALALGDVVRTREAGHEVEPLLGDVRIGDDHRNIGLMRLAHRRDHRFTVGWPDNDRIDLLLDQVFHLRDLPGHVTARVQHDSLDHVIGLGRSDEGFFIRGLIAVDADVVLRDANGHCVAVRPGHCRAGQRCRCNQRCR